MKKKKELSIYGRLQLEIQKRDKLFASSRPSIEQKNNQEGRVDMLKEIINEYFNN